MEESAPLASLVNSMYTLIPGAAKVTSAEYNTLAGGIAWRSQARYLVAEGGQLKTLRDDGKVMIDNGYQSNSDLQP